MPKRDLYTRLLYARSSRVVGALGYYLLKMLGAEVPRSVQIGDSVTLEHGGFGVVVHPNTKIGNRVKIYPGVTLGRSDIYRPIEDSRFEGIVIEDDVILAPGVKVLGSEGILRIRTGCVIGANAVLLESTGEREMWAGVPAKRVGDRP